MLAEANESTRFRRGAAMLAVLGAAASTAVMLAALLVWQAGGLAGRGGYNALCSAWIAGSYALLSVAASLIVLRSSFAARPVLAVYVFAGALAALELAAGWFYPRQPVVPTAFESAPVVGWQLRPNFTGSYSGQPLITNAHGFRSPELSAEKAGESVRVICLGDSLTFGQGSPAEQAYPQLLEGILRERLPHRRWEVVNTGVPGYCTFQQTRQLRRCVDLGYRPDLVVLLVCLNDITEKYLAMRAFGGTGLGYQGVPDGAGGWLFRKVVQLRRYSALLTALTPTRADAERREAYSVKVLWEQPEAPHIEKAWRQQESELDELFELHREQGLGLLVAVAPYRTQLSNPLVTNGPQRRLEEYCRHRGTAFLDLMPALLEAAAQAGHPAEEFYLDGSHLSAAGNRVIAESVARAIIEPATAGPDAKEWADSASELIGRESN